MSIKGVWKKFWDYMRLPDDDFEDDDDFEYDCDFEEKIDVIHCIEVDYYHPIPLPDGGFLIKIFDNKRIFNDNVGFVVVSKNYNPTFILWDGKVLDDNVELALVKHLTKFCNALKS